MSKYMWCFICVCSAMLDLFVEDVDGIFFYGGGGEYIGSLSALRVRGNL